MNLLPPPAWAVAEAECLACGYSLQGLPVPTQCPECGLPYSGRQFVLHGVADSRSTMPAWRIAVVVAVCVVASFGGPQILLLLGLHYAWWVPLVIIVGAVAGMVWFIRSAPRSYGGTGRLVFDHAGVAVLPLALKRDQSGRQRWTVCAFNQHERVEIKQVSDTWAKIRIRKPDGGTLFSGGAQIPRSMHVETLAALEWLISPPPDSDPPGSTPPDQQPLPPPLPGEGYPPPA